MEEVTRLPSQVDHHAWITVTLLIGWLDVLLHNPCIYQSHQRDPDLREKSPKDLLMLLLLLLICCCRYPGHRSSYGDRWSHTRQLGASRCKNSRLGPCREMAGPESGGRSWVGLLLLLLLQESSLQGASSRSSQNSSGCLEAPLML